MNRVLQIILKLHYIHHDSVGIFDELHMKGFHQLNRMIVVAVFVV